MSSSVVTREPCSNSEVVGSNNPTGPSFQLYRVSFEGFFSRVPLGPYFLTYQFMISVPL
jgi:hypothetical protein